MPKIKSLQHLYCLLQFTYLSSNVLHSLNTLVELEDATTTTQTLPEKSVHVHKALHFLRNLRILKITGQANFRFAPSERAVKFSL